MTRLALKIEYDGANFCGNQYQVGVRTVQQELEQALAVLAKQPVRVIFSGRTDSGVHAKGQVAHCEWPVLPLPDLSRMCWSLNGILPLDLSVTSLQWVPADFHARFSAISRKYAYRILNRPQRSPVLKTTHYLVPTLLNIKAMQTAALQLLGEHDFSAFKSSHADHHGAVCKVAQAEILNLGEGMLELWIEANRFVYNMVRVIAGTVIEIGLSKRAADDLLRVIATKDRNQAGPTAPAWGLCLESVKYPSSYGLFSSGIEDRNFQEIDKREAT
jgi:tRNA pseudouridine38-40 synthase